MEVYLLGGVTFKELTLIHPRINTMFNTVGAHIYINVTELI